MEPKCQSCQGMLLYSVTRKTWRCVTVDCKELDKEIVENIPSVVAKSILDSEAITKAQHQAFLNGMMPMPGKDK